MTVLDMILTQELIETPTTVNADFASVAVDITNRENEFSFQTIYNNGSSVDMAISLELSSDGVNFSEVTDSAQVISDATGSDLIDVYGTGANYARIKITVTAGSIDVQRIVYSAKRRH
jgi:hypothetical protein|tara:strand:- start:5 stop:358 length:354 start_codon:yes stop_codon:yes gene_type:complete